MSSEMRLVRDTIARHAGCPARALKSRLRLDGDLDMTPLELVLIAIEIEDSTGVAIPVDGLACMTTLGDVMQFFCCALRRASGAKLRSVA